MYHASGITESRHEGWGYCVSKQCLVTSGRRAVTLIELLVVIAVIGLLMAIIIPAIQSAREAARKTQCSNQLRNLALACLAHEEAHRHFPTGGWGYAWVGDPDRGFSAKQPGGWIYNVLPYLEQRDVRAVGRRLPVEQKHRAASRMMQMPVDVFACPSRRSAKPQPFGNPADLRNALPVQRVAKSDYAINAGDADFGGGPGPQTLQEGDSRRYQWNDFRQANGLSYLRSMVRRSQIIDGGSNTYLLGEKYLQIDLYETGTDPGDNESPYTGVNVDHTRGTSREIGLFPDTLGIPNKFAFGSAHGVGFHMTMCDGSAELVDFDIDPAVHETRGSRH